MSIIHGGAGARSLPYADHVRRVNSDEPFEWLRAGWRDLLAAPAVSLGYGVLFAAVGLAFTLALWRTPFFYMLVPLMSGFMLLGPVLTTGFHAISRDLERGARPSYASTWSAVSANVGPIFYAALAFMLLFLAWLRLSQLAFALTFPAVAPPDPRGMLNATFFTTGGLGFLALFCVLGVVSAAIAFACGAFALPMLIDKRVGAAEAIATSFTAVAMNMPTMAVWAVILVALVAVGMGLVFVGLVVALPIAGHAAWHAYRATIRA